MFTGIITHTGTLVSLDKKRVAELSVDADLGRVVDIGESIAVNGSCLTLIAQKSQRLTFQLSSETLALSHFGDLSRGSRVNIELPLRLDDLVGGHLVSGHLDGTARVRSLKRGRGQHTWTFGYDRPEWRPFLVHKGSVAINGVSLTLSRVQDASFSVEIIPHTVSSTNLQYLRVGERVNLELDLIAKYLYNLTAPGSRHE